MILEATPNFESVKPPNDRLRRYVYDVVSHPLFEVFILLMILLNAVIMAIVYEG